LSRLNGFVRDSVIPALKGIQENTDS
jgi:hypothetical protein